jgi:hypothetical protein
MTEAVRILLLLALAGAVVTVAASAAAWWVEEDRRLNRLIRRCLDGPPDAAIVARGHNAAAAFSLRTGEILVMRNGGAKSMLYPLRGLVGAELIVDGLVAARAFRGEPRKALDAITPEARQVLLRLIFDNPRDPDFELVLWPHGRHSRDDGGAADAIQEARSWLARAEAILRLPTPASVRPAPQDQAPDREDEEENDDEPPF